LSAILAVITILLWLFPLIFRIREKLKSGYPLPIDFGRSTFFMQ